MDLEQEPLEKTKNQPEDPLWREILQFYREELRQRYQSEHLKRYPQFQDLPEDQIDRLREFFLRRIYPPAEQRAEIDRAFEHLSLVLHSPRKLQPLMRGGLASAWRLGAKLPQAINTGRACFDAYRETRRLEEHLLREARAMGLHPEDADDRPKMLQLLTRFPDHEVKRLIRDVTALFRALNNPGLLETALEFLRLCEKTTEKRRDLYTEEDTRAFRLGIAVMEEGIGLFRSLNAEQVPRLISGIEQVEEDWYHQAKVETGEGPAEPRA
jgi:hypothetical protein